VKPHPLISVIREHVGALSPLDVCELLVLLKGEIHARGQITTASYLVRALYCYAEEISGVEAPDHTDNGHAGDNGAAA
jgi:hypothetical protein